MESIRLFDIQRCSLVDGPGLRTTVFFKGCNLRCAWCHNPESQRMERQLMLHRRLCTGCGACRRVCPHQLKICDQCGRCADYCPSRARELVGREMTVEEVYREAAQDRSYYEHSGGGVTCSGGECMLQLDALSALLCMCHENGIHTAVDTAGCVPWESFERVLPHTDLFLYDLKGWDEQAHIRNTGVSNRGILENLTHLAALAPQKVLVRIPVIPGANASREEMQAMSDFLRRLGLNRVELLPYHKMGEHKYADLGAPEHAFEVPSPDMMEQYRALFA